MEKQLKPLYDAVMAGDASAARQGVTAALEAGLDPAMILSDGMIAAMKAVGALFEEGEYFVPEMLIAARAMKEGLALLKPHLVSAEVQAMGRVLLGTVKGDLHDIGKNLVGMMLEGAGYEVVDLGTDVSPEKFVAALQDGPAGVLAMSALLTTTMSNMPATIQALQAAGLRQQVKVVVGGAPVTEAYARQIGADGYAPDASRAVALVEELLR